ncbi:hypothetical protein EON68_05065 [archaeon]|nr:MAG: hypothetical protein EON68_05065 [archaeon]
MSAHEFASTLMGPDYRDMVEPKFRKKIEALVRRQAEDEAATAVTPCPLCDTNLPAYDLDCTNCRAYLPYCIVTGKHMTIDDCSSCPHCNFPAAYSELATLLAVEPACPMCGETILPATLQLVRDPGVYLRKIAGEEAAAAAAAGDEASSK